MTDGELIFKVLFEEKGYIVERFNKHLIKQSPDFKVFLNNQLLFYCEVKDIEDLNREYFETDKKIPDEVSIILQKVYDANKQFISINPQHKVPNILAFNCKRLGMDANDLHDAILGYAEYGNDELKLFRTHRGKVDERLKNNVPQIDVFIFYNSRIDRYSAIYINDYGYYGDKISNLHLLSLKKLWK